jgi:hypothetical protein
MCVEPWEQLVLAGAALDAQLHQLLWHIRILSGTTGEEETTVPFKGLWCYRSMLNIYSKV